MPRILRIGALASLAIVLLAGLALIWVWNDRPDPYAMGIPVAAADDAARPTRDRVHLTWLGVTTLLFDDGETRLLVDGFFSRPTLLELALDREIEPDLDAIEDALAAAGIVELDAVMTVHSHFDHALDTAEVARRTGAVVIGSPSTANLARGAGLPESRIRSADPAGGRWTFGRFDVELVRSRHMPVNAAGDPPYPGNVEAPLVPPARVSEWREGGSYTIVLRHPAGTALVQGSAGFEAGALATRRADVVLLGVGGLARLGLPYAEDYWREIVRATGATRVLPVHWDDFTLRYGDVRPFPAAFEDLASSLGWISSLGASQEPRASVELLPFREPIRLF